MSVLEQSDVFTKEEIPTIAEKLRTVKYVNKSQFLKK